MLSVIIPTYQRNEQLKKLLDSIKLQSFSEIEVIVVDDNSNCKSLNKSLCEKYNFVSYFCNNENKGAPFCRNFGIEKSKFGLICLTDDDDIWEKNKLQKQISKLKSGDYGLIYTWAEVLDENGNTIFSFKSNYEGKVSKELLKNNFVPSSSVLIKKSCFQDVGLFDEKFPSCQDWEMWFRISKKYKFGVVKENLVKIYKHSGNSIGTSPKAGLGYIKFTLKYKFDYLSNFMILIWGKYLIYGLKNYLKNEMGNK